MGVELTSRTSERFEADALLLTWERRAILAAIPFSLGSVFAALQKDFSTFARVIVGILTVAAAASSAVHVFAALQDRKAAYERAARRHASVRRRIESVRAELAARGGLDTEWKKIGEIKEEMDYVAASSPNASGRLFDKTRRQLKGEFTRGERMWAWIKGLELEPLGLPSAVDGPREAEVEAEHRRPAGGV